MALPTIDALIAQHGSADSALEALREDLAITEENEDALRQPLFSGIGQLEWHVRNNPTAAREPLESAVDLDIGDAAAADTLAAVYGALGLWRDRIALQLDRLDAAHSPAERARLLADVANVYAAELREPDAALIALRKASDVAPHERVVHEAVAALARFFPDEGATLLESLAERVENDLGARAALPVLSLAAGIRATTGRGDLAQVRYERILAVDATWGPALDGLEQVYTHDEDWESLAELLARRTRLDMPAADEAALWRRIAQLRGGRLSDPAGEADALYRAWELNDSEPTLRIQLANALRAVGAWQRLATVLEASADAAAPGERAGLLAELAALHAAELAAPDTAVRTWRRVLDADPRHTAALDALEAHARAHADHGQLASLLSTRSELATDTEARVAIDRERVELLAGPLARTAEAVALLEQLAAQQPADRGVMERLAGLLEAGDAFRDLIRVLLAFARSDAPPSERVQAATRAAAIAEARLEDHAQALGILGLAEQIGGETPTLLRETARLHELLGNRDEAVRILDRLAATGDNAERIDTMLHVARLQLETNDPACADTFAAVLAIDPLHAEAFDSLCSHLTAGGAFAQLAQVIAARADAERDLQVRSALLARLGNLQATQLDDAVAAQQSWERAVELDPSNLAAVEPLVAAFVDAGSWERVPALAQQLLTDPNATRSEADRAVLFSWVGAAAEALGREQLALESYQHSLQLDPTQHSLWPALARLLDRAGATADAARAWRTVTGSASHSWTGAERIALWHEAATALEKAGDHAQAASLWREVLRADPWHAPTLRAMARGGATAATPEERLAAARSLLQLEQEPAARLALTLDIGDQLATAGDPRGAIEAYRIAIELDPGSRAALHKLLNLFMETEQWRRAAEVLGRLTELETEPTRTHRLLLTIAALFREQLDQPFEALPFLNRILDENPAAAEAADAVEQILMETGEWEQLEQHWRRQLERVRELDGDAITQLRIATLRKLATFYLETMGRPDDAIAAWRVITQIDPRDLDALEAIARTYPSGGKSDDEIIEQHQALLAVRPDRLDSWHTLFSTYRRRREFDRAWRIASVLVVMGAAEPHEVTFYEQHRPATVAMTPYQLAPEDHGQLMHPGMDYLLTRMFAVLAQTVAPAFAQDPRVLGIQLRRDRVDLTQPDNNATVIALYAQKAFGVGPFDIVRHPAAIGVAHANFETPTLLLGTDVIGAPPDRVLVFRIARAVMLLRPELYFGAVYNSPDALKTFVYASFAVFTGQVVPAPTVEAVTACAEQIRRLPEPALAELGRVVNGFLASSVSPDVSLWLKGVHLTAARAGLLLAGDLPRAVEGVHADPALLGRIEPNDCIRDLVLYSASEPYENLRAGLRLGLGQS